MYFYEPGLVAALLQVETPAQAARDPLLGGMFENMVVVELLKALWNRGRRDVLSFYRDSNSLELDIILERQRIPTAIEIKASQTFSSYFLKNLGRFSTLVPGSGEPCVLYGGTEAIHGTGYTAYGFTETYKALQ